MTDQQQQQHHRHNHHLEEDAEEDDDDAVVGNVEVDEEEVAAWRRDPEESFSDWTIHVKSVVVDGAAGDDYGNGDSGIAVEDSDARQQQQHHHTTYHVHRVYLASGTRCSLYFRTLFSTNVLTQEGASRSTTLELQPSACNAFPALLDYIYTGHIYVGGTGSEDNRSSIVCNDVSPSLDATETSATVTSSVTAPRDVGPATASKTSAAGGSKQSSSSSSSTSSQQPPMSEGDIVALLYLADYLQVRNLIPATSEYILEELSSQNCHKFCREALLYGIDWIVDCCLKIASSSPKHLCSKIESLENNGQQTGQEESGRPMNGDAPDTSAEASVSPVPVAETRERGSGAQRAVPTKPPAQQVLEMLPPSQQVELLQLSLRRSVDELVRFKRVPSRWKENIDETAVATHMPQMATMTGNNSGINNGNNAVNNNGTSEFFHQPYASSLTGCGLPFHNKVCPVFYFDEAIIRNNVDQGADDNENTISGLLRPGETMTRMNISSSNNSINPPSPEGHRLDRMRGMRLRRPTTAAAAAAAPTLVDAPAAGAITTINLQRRHEGLEEHRRRMTANRNTTNSVGDTHRNNNRIIVRGTSQNAMHRD